MILVHKGVRPEYPIHLLDFKRKIYYEEYPDGSIVLWNKKLLNSGCNIASVILEEMRGCFYCPLCKEWFSRSQWE